MEGERIDGNNILEVYHTINEIAREIRQNPRPVLLECMTFRMRGHEEASGTKYVPQHLFDQWKEKDPLTNFEKYLLNEGSLSQEAIKVMRSGFTALIDMEIEKVFSEADIVPDAAIEIADMYQPLPIQSHTAFGQ